MAYGVRSKDNPNDVGRSADQNQSVDNEAYLYANIRYIGIEVFDPLSNCLIGDGKKYFDIPADLNGMNLVSCHAYHPTPGATAGPTLINIHNETDNQDFLSTRLMIDTGEKGSDTAATPYVIDTAHDDLATFDILRIDVDQLPTGTVPKGLILTLGFQHP